MCINPGHDKNDAHTNLIYFCFWLKMQVDFVLGQKKRDREYAFKLEKGNWKVYSVDLMVWKSEIYAIPMADPN